MTPEGKVKEAVKRWCKERAFYHFMPVQTGRGRKTVDFLICARGRFLAVEAKATRNDKPTALQEHELCLIEAAGGEGWLVCFDEDGFLEWRRCTSTVLETS